MRTKHRIGWIWPREPESGNPVKWSKRKLWKDVFTNKGPDIFIGPIDKAEMAPTRQRWSRWTDVYGPSPKDSPMPPISRCADRGQKKYDFRTRTYKIPDAMTWSNVEYAITYGRGNGAGQDPIVVADRFGNVYYYQTWLRYRQEGLLR